MVYVLCLMTSKLTVFVTEAFGRYMFIFDRDIFIFANGRPFTTVTIQLRRRADERTAPLRYLYT